MSAWSSVVQARALMGRQGLLGLRGVSERDVEGELAQSSEQQR